MYPIRYTELAGAIGVSRQEGSLMGTDVSGPSTGALTADEPDPNEGLYVPVTNLSYIPEGGGVPQGFVPGHPKDDKVLGRLKEALEAQGLESGQDVDPGEGVPEEAVSPTDEGTEEDSAPESESSEVPEETGSKPLF